MPEYDAITPVQWVLFLWAALIVFSIMWWLFWHVGRGDTPIERDDAEPGEMVTRAWYALLHWRPSHMSSAVDATPPHAGTEAVHVPVRDTGTAASTSTSAAGGTDGTAPDTDAANAGTSGWEAPRLSTRLTDTETVTLLAVQRGKDGKHRYSANQIHALIGGARADVLAQVREVRQDAPAVFRPLSDEQQQLREQLQLSQR